MKKILIRFDDICPTMNWELWEKAESLLVTNDIKPLIGVIPNCTDPDLQLDNARTDFWEWLKEKQDNGYAIAMHGVNHVFCSLNRGILTTRIGSEFAGVPYDKQLQNIRKGKEIFESHGIHTDIFFAPGHSYDENTVKALAACGFKYMSDGKSSKAYTWHGIKFLPCRNSGATFNKREEYSTSIYHAHEWIQNDKNAFPTLERIVKNYVAQIVSFDTYCQQPTGKLWLQRWVENVYVWLQFSIAPKIRRCRI